MFRDFYDEVEISVIESAITQAFSKFKQYCTTVMELRMQEAILEKEASSNILWPHG